MNNKGLPLVTVFTLIYNTNPEFVIEAIESIRAQTYPNIQHIIIDDCSTRTDSKEVVKKWIAENQYDCLFFEHESNYGLCKTLNHVLDLAKGEYIIGCSDDILLEYAIEKHVSFFNQLDSEYGMIYGDMSVFDADPNSSIIQSWSEAVFNSEPPSGWIYKKLLLQYQIPAPAIMIRRSVYLEVGYYDEDLGFEDLDMSLRIAKIKKIGYNNIQIAKYRRHGNNLSTLLSGPFIYEAFKVYLKHFNEKENVLLIKNNIYHIANTLLLHNSPESKEVVEFIFKNYSFVSLEKRHLVLLKRLISRFIYK